MTERLAIPAWTTPPTTIETWIDALNQHVGPVKLTRDGPTEGWFEIESRRVAGYAMIEGPHVSALNFEIHAVDPLPPVRDLEAACLAIGWELHVDDEDENDDED